MSRFRRIWSGILIRKTQTNSEGARGTGPRATVSGGFLGSRTAPFIVGRGPVPRHVSGLPNARGGQAPRYGNRTVFLPEKRHPLTVGRGPVPRRAPVYRTLAGDRPPRYGNRTVFLPEKRHPLTVGRGPVPRHAPVYQTLAGDRPRATVTGRFLHARGGQAPALR